MGFFSEKLLILCEIKPARSIFMSVSYIRVGGSRSLVDTQYCKFVRGSSASVCRVAYGLIGFDFFFLNTTSNKV